mgnify:CR=1 FL=1
MNRLRQLKKSDWVAIALAGVLILIIAMPLSPKQSDGENTAGQETAGTVSDSGNTQGSQNAYAAALEKRLKHVLGQMEGVGKTEVMITLSDSGETIVEKDQKEQTNRIEESDASGGTRTTTDQEMEETTVYVENSSEKHPYVTKEVLPKVEGVLVVAEGGDDPKVISDISDTVMALFRVEAHKIKVVKMSSSRE